VSKPSSWISTNSNIGDLDGLSASCSRANTLREATEASTCAQQSPPAQYSTRNSSMARRACADCARTAGTAMRVLVSSNILCAICLLVFGCTVRQMANGVTGCYCARSLNVTMHEHHLLLKGCKACTCRTAVAPARPDCARCHDVANLISTAQQRDKPHVLTSCMLAHTNFCRLRGLSTASRQSP
jgi:hypothetical protein